MSPYDFFLICMYNLYVIIIHISNLFYSHIPRLGSFRIAERRGMLKDSTGTTSLLRGAGVAGVGGALGSIAGTPYYLVKVRLQSQAARAIAVGHQHEVSGTMSALVDIFRKEGVKGITIFEQYLFINWKEEPIGLDRHAM